MEMREKHSNEVTQCLQQAPQWIQSRQRKNKFTCRDTNKLTKQKHE